MVDREPTDEGDGSGDKGTSQTPKPGPENGGWGPTGGDDGSRRWWIGAWDQR